MATERVYFKNLNALRFFAALAVIFHHVEQYKFWARVPSAWGNTVIDALGQKAVSFFFVLSGFLITYLLLEENRQRDDISVRNFYVRRILRIWPVYYLVVFVCLVVLPNVIDLSFLGIDTYDSKFTLKAFFLLTVLPNILRVYSPSVAGGNQLWSIGVEEQFYIVWPLLIRFFIRRMISFLIAFVALKFVVTIVLHMIAEANGTVASLALYRFWVFLKVEQMAIGGIGAWILFARKEKVLRMVYSKPIWYVSIVAVIGLMTIPFQHLILSYVEAFIFLSVIMNLSTNPSIGISLEHPLLNRLGNISYGIYMYHAICITICIYVLTLVGLHKENFILFNVLLYSSSLVATLLTAFFSYEYFEKFFLSMKEKFMIVKSNKESDAACADQQDK
jgi:peptidoglycan/LPS O-acetylase OafA/YrhL